MPRPPSPQLTDAENRIMTELWNRGEASVRELTDALVLRYDLAYTTVLTTVRIMADKGYVDFRKEGRAHIFFPVLSRAGAQRTAIGSLVKSLFGGSPQSLAQHLVEDEKLTLDDIEALREALIRKTSESEADQ
jgi:BlaI family penicillinase repressor